MKVAIAQIVVEKGNLPHNLARHLFFCGLAANEKADLVVFPELSLTGYEPELAQSLVVEMDHRLWDDLKNCAKENQLIIIAGMPLRTAQGVQIGSVLVSPDGTTKHYAKQNLYPGEDKYFIAGTSDLQFTLGDEKLSMAICADISNPDLPKQAFEQGSNIYLAAVMVSKKGLAHDRTLLQNYARQYGMLTVMANYGGTTGGYDCGGYSSVWSAKGTLIGELANDGEGMLVIEKSDGEWKTHAVTIQR